MAITLRFEAAEGPAKRKYVRRRKSGEQNVLDIAFEPLVKVGRGRRGKRLSAAEVVLQQALTRAEEGSVKDLGMVLKFDQENQRARAQHEEKYGKGPPARNNKGRAAEAGLILDILVLSTNLNRLPAYWDSGSAEFSWEPMLSEWAYEAGYRKVREADDGCYPGFQRSRFVIAPEVIGEAEHQAKVDFLAERKAWRQPSRHQWPRGLSGRKATRHAIPLVLPFPWLEELVVVQVEGRGREMTRCEALIYQLQHRARSGDAAVARVLAPLLARRQLEDWKSKSERPWLADAPSDVFDAMRDLRLVSRRAKKTCLYEPWIVSLAIERLGERRLTPDEQAVVERSTRKPNGNLWPDWWAPCLDRETVASRHDIPDNGPIIRS